MLIATMDFELVRTGTQAKLYTKAGCHRLMTECTLEDLDRLRHWVEGETRAWRRDQSRLTHTHYDTLGISRTATGEDIQSAYRTLAKRNHPDMATGDTAAMQPVNEAYDTLSDPVKRQVYDTTL